MRANFPSISSKEFWAAKLWLGENPSSSKSSSLIEGATIDPAIATVDPAIDSSFSILVHILAL